MERVTNSLLTISTVFLMVFVSNHVKGARTIKEEEQLDLAAQPAAAVSDPGTPLGSGGSFPFPGFKAISGGFGGLPPIPCFGSGAPGAGWLCTILPLLPGCLPAQTPSGVPPPPSPEAGGATPVPGGGGGSGSGVFATAPA